MITREDLRKYQEVLNELQGLDVAIEQAYNTYKSPAIMNDYHRTGQPNTDGPTPRALERIEKLKKKRLEIWEWLERVENGIEEIEDSRERTICRLHYICGYTWQATCIQMRKHSSTPMLVEYDRRYWEKREKERQTESA